VITWVEGTLYAAVVRSLLWIVAEGASLGLALAFVIWRRVLPGYVVENALDPLARRQLLLWMAGGGGGAALFALAWLWRRRGAGVAALERAAAAGSPLCATAGIPLLLDRPAWKGLDLNFAVLAGLLALGLGALWQRALATQPPWPERARRAGRWLDRPALPFTLAALAAAAYAVYFSGFALVNHYNLATSAFDLGIEDNLVWNASHLATPLFRSTPLGGAMTHLGLHQTYFSYLLALPYRLFPDARFLLVFQAAMMGLAALPLFLHARRRLGPWPACLLAWLYVLYPPLHGANLYDFHYQPLSAVFIFAFVHLMETDRPWLAGACAFFTLTLREDMGALLVVACLWLALRGARPLVATLIGAVAALHFVVLKMIVMPMFLGGVPAYIHQYRGLLPAGQSSFGGVLETVLANPGYTLSWLLEPAKLLYVLQILGPLAFWPLRRARGWLLLAPGFFFTLLQTRYPALTEISFQYTAYWIPFVFLATVDGLAAAGARTRRAALLTLPVALLVFTSQFGAVLHRDDVRGGFDVGLHYSIDAAARERHDVLEALLARIPPDASVAASNRIVPHVSARANAYELNKDLLDADWIIAALPVSGRELDNLNAALGRDGAYGVVEMRADLCLIRRGHARDRNPAALAAAAR
jgi:uncharacterized membrane protein